MGVSGEMISKIRRSPSCSSRSMKIDCFRPVRLSSPRYVACCCSLSVAVVRPRLVRFPVRRRIVTTSSQQCYNSGALLASRAKKPKSRIREKIRTVAVSPEIKAIIDAQETELGVSRGEIVAAAVRLFSKQPVKTREIQVGKLSDDDRELLEEARQRRAE